MKKQLVSIIALCLALTALAAALFALSDNARRLEEQKLQISELQADADWLRSELARLSAQATAPQTAAPAGGLFGWFLDVTPWETMDGADVRVTAVPDVWQEGMTARLSVKLEGEDVQSAACEWSGDVFTGTVALVAADGYSYTLLLELPDGTRKVYALTSPEDPVQEIPVYLAGSLCTYCNLTVSSWEAVGDEILLRSAYAQVQLPLLSRGAPEDVASARLVLLQNGTEIHSVPLTLLPGLTTDTYALDITDVTLPLPELAGEDMLELQLAVTLTSGETRTAIGITWFPDGDALGSAVG